ncbi:hypothetical protein ZIOFF_032500 [Zingiber officinale]|uniref:Uncharacterized protein n=1 Tax=Zingiber officinale TaxID=94328 RepID=A0A8J5GVJ0_ZINOF|nr:hypothetical protein ZIOFF_032500 [Zingiber officinale]
MIARLSNTPNVAFAYKVSGVVDYLTSHGVNALPGRRYSTSQLQGMNWVIRPTQINFPMQSSEIATRSSIASKLGIHVGAGVINNDYQGDQIAQLIISPILQDNTSSTLTDYIRGYCVVEDEFFVAVADATLEEEEEPWDMEYLQLARLAEHVYSSSVITTYRPPTYVTMGLANYPPPSPDSKYK